MTKLDIVFLRLAIILWAVVLLLSVTGAFAPRDRPMPMVGTADCTEASQSLVALIVPVCKYN